MPICHIGFVTTVTDFLTKTAHVIRSKLNFVCEKKIVKVLLSVKFCDFQLKGSEILRQRLPFSTALAIVQIIHCSFSPAMFHC